MQLTPEAAARQDEAERQPLKPQELKEWMSAKEREDGERLAEFTGTEFDRAVRVLRKHDGNMDKAAESLLNGGIDDAEERRREEDLASIKQDFAHMFPESRATEAPPRSNNVIDLTGDDDDAPMDSTRFRATTRSPDPAWQMVRSNQAVKSEDDKLKEVLQASWNDFAAEESDTMPIEEITQREGGRPIALRADMAGKAYAALVIQCLFHVPQVRQRCSKLHLHLIDGKPPQVNPDWAMWSLIEMFTALDLAEISVLLDQEMLNAWETATLKQSDSVGTLSKQFLERVTRLVQSDLEEQKIEAAPGINKLFRFKHSKIHNPPTGPPEPVFGPDYDHIVSIEINPESPGASNELVARLSQTLNDYNEDGSSYHQLIEEPSEMVTFEIIVNMSSSTGGASPEPFVFPKCIYMDQFLEANLDLANETRLSQRQIQRDLEMLTTKKRSITRFEDQDTFENLRGAIDYYENIAHYDNEERSATLKTMATKLKNTLQRLESEVAVIDEKISSLQSELDGLFENPELQCHPYDLRAVLVHTGLPGRKHIYSYVQDKGTWWKTVDYTVTEVSEDLVLSDPAGLHLGAGPYMLMYSRRQIESEMNEPVNWPPVFVESTTNNNATFLSELGSRPPIAGRSGAGAGDRDGDAMDLD
ncbi:hypothetical protein B0H19DRAFT_1167841 [Mycena capillaripes]|nr:hypothetical protein B0H19DRAFT_1167841 [Mycena capillaripes]